MATTGHWSFTHTRHKRFLTCAFGLALLVLLRGWWRERTRRGNWPALRAALPPALMVMRDFLPFLLALVLYETLHDLTAVVRPNIVDGALAALDRSLFGVDVAA